MSKVLVDREFLDKLASELDGADFASYGWGNLMAAEVREVIAQPAEALIYAPVEPSLEMQNAGWREIAKQGTDPEELDVASIYRAMLASCRDTI